MRTKKVKISDIYEDPANARKHSQKNIDAIKGSLLRFEQQKPIVVDEKGVVVAGNGTLEAARQLGWEHILAVTSKLIGSDRTAYALADNRTTDLSEWDDDVLGKTLQSLYEEDYNIAEIGFDPGDYDWGKPDTKQDTNEKTDEEPDAPYNTSADPNKINLILGDSLDKLKELPDNSVDSLVTDPPAGISFMGKSWDDDKGGPKEWIRWLESIMVECKRVMKPGAHGLVWALPRTSHWTATALEQAGFEIRDVVCHLFGQGFPKSHDISKGIDKLAGVEREKGEPISYADGTTNRKTARHFDDKDNLLGVECQSKPSTEDAIKYDGWGTGLKPSNEHWILIRKPISEKTVALNVLKHGTGGINIDGCRVGRDDTRGKTGDRGDLKIFDGLKKGFIAGSAQGRFPANTVFSHHEDCGEKCHPDCAVFLLDEQSGVLKSGDKSPDNNVKDSSGWSGGSKANRVKNTFESNSGGASRFFYCSKASASDKGGKGNKHPTVKNTNLMKYFITLVTPHDGTVLDCFMGSGSTGVAASLLDLRFIGIEKEQEYFDIAKSRLGIG